LARSNALPKVHGDQANEVETSPAGRNDRAEAHVMPAALTRVASRGSRTVNSLSGAGNQ